MSDEYSSSIDQISADEDLLTQILIRLPVKSLLRLKSVSKNWSSLITSPHFVRRRNPDPCSVSGLFLYSSGRRLNHLLNLIPLQNNGDETDDQHDYSQSLSTIANLPLDMKIFSSCHGLLFCTSFAHTGNHGLHVLNPTTKQFTTLPDHHDGVKGLCLAFDPSRSPHYKVVCVWGSVSILSTKPYESEWRHHIEIYSSETRAWRASGDPFVTDDNAQFLGGVYWNGAVHWFNTRGDSLYFNVEEERLGTMPMPLVPPGEWKARPFRYCGESRGHLHLVEIYGPMTRFSVHEMERDYSGWFVKYVIDLDNVGTAFPGMMHRLSWDPMYYSFAILSLVREGGGEREEGSFLVLHLPGKVVRYNIVDKSFEKIGDLAPEHCDSNGMIEDSLRYYYLHAFQYIETVSCI